MTLIALVNAASAGELSTHEVQRRLGSGHDDRTSAPAAIDVALTCFEKHDRWASITSCFANK